jgi:hypothetical protein
MHQSVFPVVIVFQAYHVVFDELRLKLAARPAMRLCCAVVRPTATQVRTDTILRSNGDKILSNGSCLRNNTIFMHCECLRFSISATSAANHSIAGITIVTPFVRADITP